MTLDNAPGGEDHEDYERGDLSGLVVDIDGDHATVRFIHFGVMTCRIVTRVDGSLAIDPSGIPKQRIKRLPAGEALRAGEAIGDGEAVTLDDSGEVRRLNP